MSEIQSRGKPFLLFAINWVFFRGLQLFTEQGKFVRPIGESFQNCYYGLAEDCLGNVLTINHRDAAKPCGAGTNTRLGHTDVFFINPEGVLCKQMELEDLAEREDEKVRWEHYNCHLKSS